MDNVAKSAAEQRRHYIEAWNNTMIDIWQERIFALDVIDTQKLYKSVATLATAADGRVVDITLSEQFLEYGLWQNFGTGKEVPIGNRGDIGRAKRRLAKKWMSPKYYGSVLNLRDFLIDSLGKEFVGMCVSSLDNDAVRRNSAYYKRKFK